MKKQQEASTDYMTAVRQGMRLALLCIPFLTVPMCSAWAGNSKHVDNEYAFWKKVGLRASVKAARMIKAEVHRFNRRNCVALTNAGLCYERTGQYALARQRLQSALNYLPATLLFALVVLGSIWFMFTGSKNELAPTEDQSILFFQAVAPQTASLEYNEAYTREIIEGFEAVPEYHESFLLLGFGGEPGQAGRHVPPLPAAPGHP